MVFEGHGDYPGDYDTTLIEKPECHIDAPKRIAHRLEVPLKQKLQELEANKIITKTEEPTDWVHYLDIVQKTDGSLRLCLSPKTLNACIRREHYQIPTLDDALPDLAGKRVFSVLDENNAYWQISLDEESSDLCTFNTPFGRYILPKMPFGISSAAEVPQRKTYHVFGDIPEVHVIVDDMLIAGEDETDHGRIVRKVLERGIQNNIKFNFNKLRLKQPSVIYNGAVISAEGKKKENKVIVMNEIPDPTDKEGVRRLIGMVNYLTPFIPKQSWSCRPSSFTAKKWRVIPLGSWAGISHAENRGHSDIRSSSSDIWSQETDDHTGTCFMYRTQSLLASRLQAYSVRLTLS